MFEYEKKIMLSSAEYNLIRKPGFGFGAVQTQTNYYYDTDDLEYNEQNITLRIREKNGEYEATVKKHYDEPENYSTIDKSNCLYLALHSNAGADGGTTARGVVAFYNSIGEAFNIATSFIEPINSILPTGSNRWKSVLKADNTEESDSNLGELREPYKLGIPAVLIENGFHDNPNEVEFLITKQKLLADTIGKVIVDYYKLTAKQ